MSEHLWPPQPGDLVKVERSTCNPVAETVAMIGNTYRLFNIDEDGDFAINEDGTWFFHLSDLSPPEPPKIIEQFGRTYRLDEGWQPIETAPHGEKVVLAWQRQDGTFTMCVDRASWDWRLGDYRSGQSRHHKATHWMPLPAGPSTKEPTP